MHLLVILTVIFMLFTGAAEAINPDLSNWTKNLSESDQPAEPGDPDYDPQIIVAGNTVHMLWTAINADWSGYKLYYRRSVDGGKTWKPKVLLMSDPDSLISHTYRRMAVDGNNVHIFQPNYGTPPPSGCIWNGILTYFRSTDNGATFEPARNVIYSEAPNCYWHVANVYVSASGGKVAAGYRYSKNDGPYTDVIGVLTSSDNGDTFANHTVMQNDDDLALDDMALNGNNIHMAVRHIHGYLNGGYDAAYDLYVASSTNFGATFVSRLVSVPSNVLDGNGIGVHKTYDLQGYHYSSNLAASGNNVSIVWTGIDSTGVTSVFYRRSTNNGTSFEAAKNLSKPVLPSGRNPVAGLETIAAKGNYVYVVFVEDGTSRVLFRGSADAGATFGPLKELTKEGYSYIAGGWWPVVVTDPADATGATVHVFWTGPKYVVSNNGGASFTNPVMIATNLTSASNDRPQMAVGTDGVIHFAMEGINRAGYDTDIFYRRFNPVATSPLAANRALRFSTSFINGDVFMGIYDNMQVKATSDINFKGAMTADAWVKVNRDSNVSGYFLFKADPGAGGAWGSYMLGQWSSGQVDARITTTDGTTKTGWVLVAGDSVPSGVWTHVAMTYDAAAGPNNFKIYVNGTLAGAMTVTGNLATGHGTLFAGGDSSNRYRPYLSTDTNDVTIDDLRLWNRALSQNEIKKYMSGVTGTEPGLRAYYNFNGTTKDITGHGNDGILMYKETYVAGQAAPAVPTGVAAKAIASDKIAVSWDDKSFNESGFEIDRATGGCTATSWATIARVAQGTEAFVNSGLSADTTYSYRVRAYNSQDSVNSACVTATTYASGVPSAPTGLKAVSAGTDSIRLAWLDNSANETKFQIFRKKDAGAWTLLHSTASNIKSFNDSTAAGNTSSANYQYYLKACNNTACSTGTAVAIVPLKAASLNASAVSSNQVNLTWTGTNITNETGFEIERSNTDCASATAATWNVIGTKGINAGSYADLTVAAGSTYAYRVRAVAESASAPYATGYSGYTACVQVTTP